MGLNQFQLVNNSNSKGLKFAYAEGFGDSITVTNISIQQAGSQSTSNYSRNWGGFKRILNVNFVLTNDGTDKSTDSSSKVTLKEQRAHLMTTVMQGVGSGDSQSDITYTLTVYEDGTLTTYNGAVEEISCQWATDRSNVLTGTISFSEGS